MLAPKKNMNWWDRSLVLYTMAVSIFLLFGLILTYGGDGSGSDVGDGLFLFYIIGGFGIPHFVIISYRIYLWVCMDNGGMYMFVVPVISWALMAISVIYNLPIVKFLFTLLACF